MPLPPPYPVPLTVLPEHPCPYLHGRTARLQAFVATGLPSEAYHEFMDAGFRRNGRVIYQPACPDCNRCIPIRIPVGRFVPSKSQRRVLRRNRDVSVAISTPQPTDEKYLLYSRYLRRRHDALMADDRESFEEFLYDSPVQSLEFCYRDRAGKLLALGLCDVCATALSSVYFCFDPDAARRSPGTFSVLCEIDFARRSGIDWYYLGFWIAGCRAMGYKANFRPHQLLTSDSDGRASIESNMEWRDAGPDPAQLT